MSGSTPRVAGGARLSLLLGVVAAVGCAPLRGGWDVGALEARVPALESVGAARLGDLPPHFLPQQGNLTLFLCRWSTLAAIPVSLPADATATELELLRGALIAWADAGLGVSFEQREYVKHGIEITFAVEGRGRSVPKGAGDTIADCALGGGGEAERLDVGLRHASILLRRSNTDLLGRRVPITRDELMGAALHEIGHALGFSGHVAPGASIMSATTESVRRAGKRVNDGEPFRDATLMALYAVPNGSVVGSVPLAPGAMARFDRLSTLTGNQRLDGPLTRVGDRSARIFWQSERGVPFSLRVQGWPSVIGRSRQIIFEANPPAELLMQRGDPREDSQ
ncbi:MAG: hypothetical protein JRE70_18725 [Deltaproteobacteria bacterium]|nr:hypothetical protein [Deltaproteobacteria bacterium]